MLASQPTYPAAASLAGVSVGPTKTPGVCSKAGKPGGWEEITRRGRDARAKAVWLRGSLGRTDACPWPRGGRGGLVLSQQPGNPPAPRGGRKQPAGSRMQRGLSMAWAWVSAGMGMARQPACAPGTGYPRLSLCQLVQSEPRLPGETEAQEATAEPLHPHCPAPAPVREHTRMHVPRQGETILPQMAS